MLALASGSSSSSAADRSGPARAHGLARAPRAVLFDLDGTLYSQPPLRAGMALELAARFLDPAAARTAARVVRTLRAFRRIREDLRGRELAGSDCLERLQFTETAGRVGLAPADVEAIVEEWMLRRPLRYLRMCRRPGLRRLLRLLRDRRTPCGVLSDYPADAKLRALGVGGDFFPVLCTTDPAINALKPHPAGFLKACRAWRLTPADVLYVGDRPAVDAAGAKAAGMPCFIVGPLPFALWRLYRALADLPRR